MSKALNLKSKKKLAIVVPTDVFVGGSLMGSIDAGYYDLVKAFGKPNGGTDGYKADVEWNLMTPAGGATIYNYKTGKNYLGKKEGLAKTKIRDWHIGGQTTDVIAYIEAALKQ